MIKTTHFIALKNSQVKKIQKGEKTFEYRHVEKRYTVITIKITLEKIDYKVEMNRWVAYYPRILLFNTKHGLIKSSVSPHLQPNVECKESLAVQILGKNFTSPLKERNPKS